MKANEIAQTLKDEKFRISLFNLMNVYEKLGETDHVMKQMSEIPKFDTIVNVNKISLVLKLIFLISGLARKDIQRRLSYLLQV